MKAPEEYYPIWIETIAHQKFRNTDRWRESECMQFAQAYSDYVQEQVKPKKITGKAKYPDDSKWRYKGLTLDIIKLNSVNPFEGNEWRLSLKGTKWADQKYTVVFESDLEWVKLDKQDVQEQRKVDISKTITITASEDIPFINSSEYNLLMKALENIQKKHPSIKFNISGFKVLQDNLQQKKGEQK